MPMRPACVARQHLKTNIQTSYIKILDLQFSKFHMEHDQTPGSQNDKTESGRISKMTAVTENNKNNKINFFSKTSGYLWLNFSKNYQWNIGI